MMTSCDLCQWLRGLGTLSKRGRKRQRRREAIKILLRNPRIFVRYILIGLHSTVLSIFVEVQLPSAFLPERKD